LEGKDRMAMSPTQRTLKRLREEGYKAWVVERWLAYAGKFGKRQDLFGIIDVLAISSDAIIGVQACSGSFTEHYRKLTEEKNQESYDWILCPNRYLEIWSWRKLLKERGKKMKIWQPRIHRISLGELDI